MYNFFVEYNINGYNDIIIHVDSFDSLQVQLQKIKRETEGIFTAPFSVDVVIEGKGRMSIALDDNTVLCYKSEDLEIRLTTVGDVSAEGDVTIYFGDYSILSRRYFITYNLALDVLNDWIKTGELSDKVRWTDELL